MYHFTISCKDASFLIYKLKSFSCKIFAMFFLLWGNGGPNWKRYLDIWIQEQEAEWTLVGARKSYADVVHAPPKHQPRKVFLRLQYPRDYHLNYLQPNHKPHTTTKTWVEKRAFHPDRRVLRGQVKEEIF